MVNNTNKTKKTKRRSSAAVAFGKMSQCDDDQIVATPYDSGMNVETLFRDSNTKVTAMYRDEAGVDESKLSVFLEVAGAGYVNERAGVDIVAILDVGDSMKGDKLNTLKAVMRLLIDKLSSSDRLSLVTFSKDSQSQRLCALRQMTVVYKAEIEKLVTDLETYPGKDINGGIEMALEVINGRKHAHRQRVAILLMSDGNQLDAIEHLSLKELPVYTFEFGVDDQKSMVLKDIAKKCGGGSYCPIDVSNSVSGNLSAAVSECMAKLLGVVVNDLNLTIEKADSTTKIENISVGTYSQSYIPFSFENDHVTVSLGDVYANETCRVKVDLLLSHVTVPQLTDLLNISYSCRTRGEVFKSRSQLVSVARVANLVPDSDSSLLEVGYDKLHEFFKPLKLPNMETLGMNFSRPKLFSARSEIKDEPQRVRPRDEAVISNDVDNDQVDLNHSEGTFWKMFMLSRLIFISRCIHDFIIQPLLVFISLTGTRILAMLKSPSKFERKESRTVEASDSKLIFSSEENRSFQEIQSSDPNKKVNTNELANIDLDESQGTILKVFGSKIISISKCIYENLARLVLLLPFIVETSIQAMLRSHSTIVINIRKYMNFEEETHNRVLVKGKKAKTTEPGNESESSDSESEDSNHQQNINVREAESNNYPTILTLLKGFGLQVIFTSSFIYNYIFPRLLSFLSLLWMSILAQIKSNAPINDSERRVVFPVPKVDSRVVFPVPINDPERSASNYLKQAFDSVKILRQILGGFMSQYIGFEEKEGELNDSARTEKVKALHNHINLASASIRSIENILRNAPEVRHKQDRPTEFININNVEESVTDNPTKAVHAVSDPLPLPAAEDVSATELKDDECEKVLPTESMDSSTAVKNITDHLVHTFDSVRKIRKILDDYMKQHNEFKVKRNDSSDPVRSENVKALGGHLIKAFGSVEAIEGILQIIRSVPA